MLDTIIVGAGFSGLAAAKQLKAGDCENYVVLEARERVGGRTKHGKLAGLDIDLGGMWLGPSQTRLAAMAAEYGAETFPMSMTGKSVFRIQGKQHLGEGEDIDGLFNLLDGVSYLAITRKLNKLVDGVDREQPWAHPKAKQLDELTLEQWLQKNVRGEPLRTLYRLLCFSLCCCEASQVSMLFFAMYLKSGDGLEPMCSGDEGGAQNLLFHGGVHQIARKMAAELGDKLRLAEPVVSIDWSAEAATVRSAKGEYQARNVIISVPATLLHKIEFTPALPQPKTALHRKLSMGSCIKFWVAYKKPFWREQGFSGMILRDDVPCSPSFDATPPDQPLGVIAGFFDGNHAINHSDIGQHGRRQLVLDMLAEHFGEQARAPLEYLDENWTATEWSNGCYGAYAPPGVYADYGEWLRKPIGALHWAGTETASRWTGYIDGAIRSGERAAEEVLLAAN